jgi:hypothetical protein
VLGLNISATFNSAVTIYIIIPLLLIPQILLSGVVVQFDQLNPAFGSKARVPFIGDIMISRWAYEAMMVNQFKNNKYEKIFYDLDKEISLADYRTVYYLPRLRTMLEFVFTNKDSEDEEIRELIRSNFEILGNEIKFQVETFGKDKFPYLDRLTEERLDSATFLAAQQFLSTINKVHVNRNRTALKEKEKLIREMTASPRKVEAFNKLRQDNINDQVTSLVFDNKEKTRILEHKGRLIQQIYPIFSDPEPVNYFDFRTLFYVPQKYFAGRLYETLLFNATIMWMMTLTLIIMLYFDAFRKLITMGDGLKSKP